ncbi:MAG TPA: DUF362 domain-containing protein [Candidatus Acidoferrales bacterium]|jgi:uncharacterized protein (DUF362 family)|nr:DUF362 domain-containing protein [Candidatus Acidoferrales bacterium]
MTRREWLAMISAAPLLTQDGLTAAVPEAPTAPVAIAKCASYDEDVTARLGTMFDQLGGIEKLVRGKTVTIKINMTGPTSQRVQGRALGLTHYTHPKLVGATAYLLGRAGARRIRFVESAWGTGGPLEDVMLDSGWNVRSLQSAAPGVEFENTNALGKGKRYSTFTVPGSAYMYPAYVLNHAYEETDVFVSLAKLKNHATCGVTLSMKNCFGMTPASIYGDDAGRDEPNESPTKGRQAVCHDGKRQPSKIAPAELHPTGSREAEYRIPHVTADLAVARPIHLAILDGVESIAGGEGPWIRGVRMVKPGVLIAGMNPVTTDAVSTAVMGYNPRALRGTAPFQRCENTLLLAEGHGVGTTDLKRVEVRGVPIEQALYRYDS